MSYVEAAKPEQRFAVGTRDGVACVILLECELDEVGRVSWIADDPVHVSLLNAIYFNSRLPHIRWQ